MESGVMEGPGVVVSSTPVVIDVIVDGMIVEVVVVNTPVVMVIIKEGVGVIVDGSIVIVDSIVLNIIVILGDSIVSVILSMVALSTMLILKVSFIETSDIFDMFIISIVVGAGVTMGVVVVLLCAVVVK